MKHKLFISIIFTLFATVVFTKPVFAEEVAVHTVADGHQIEYKKIDRVEKVRKFFFKYKSPLVNSAETFVKVADTYKLDYRLMPAISCLESGCGKQLMPNSYNPFGWGGGYIYFKSWTDGIEKVGKGINEIYYSKGLDTPEKMSRVYAPPSKTWGSKVRYFMNQIEAVDES